MHGGRWAVRIERKDDSPSAFTALSKTIPVDFAGMKLELRGFLRTENVSDFTGLWMRQDDDGGSVAFDNMQRRRLKGTTEWAEYSIVLPLNAAAKRLTFGVLASGTGRVWADDLRLFVDDKPIETVPQWNRPKTAVDFDHEFDAGSGIALKDLTTIQIANLATLGKVWGFLKYHHPIVVGGRRHWDYDLFRILPKVLAAADGPAARAAIYQWVTGLGTVAGVQPLRQPQRKRAPLAAARDVADRRGLGAELASALRDVHRNRPAAGRQFYVSGAELANPCSIMNSLREYRTSRRGLSAAGALSFLEHHRILVSVPRRDWRELGRRLTAFIPRIALANDGNAYKLQLMALIARSTILTRTCGAPWPCARRSARARFR